MWLWASVSLVQQYTHKVALMNSLLDHGTFHLTLTHDSYVAHKIQWAIKTLGAGVIKRINPDKNVTLVGWWMGVVIPGRSKSCTAIHAQ